MIHMKKHLIGVVGFFGNGISTAGGQEAKTCALTKAFQQTYGDANVITVDTLNWKKRPVQLLAGLVHMARDCKNVFMLPAQNSLRIFAPLFVALRFFCKCKVHYAVVGGWLPQKTAQHKTLSFFAKKLDGIYVETSSMKTALEEQGFSNASILPNFKFITPVKPEDLPKEYGRPYKLCTFSRVMKEKGIEDAIDAVTQVNQQYGETVLQLDIYGKIDPDYEDRFRQITAQMPAYIRYCGMVEPEESVAVLKDYFALLFPTHYATEGVPGTIIDAYAAGVPVISALWDNCADIFTEGVTGWGYALGDKKALADLMNKLVLNANAFAAMKRTTLQEAGKYQPDRIIKQMDLFILK